MIRTKVEVVQKLGLRENIEDILITLDTQYHLLRLIRGTDEKLFFYLVLNRAQANLAMARRDLRVIEQEFYLAHPSNNARPAQPGPEGQFFPLERPALTRDIRER